MSAQSGVLPAFPQLVTRRQIVEETGLPTRTVQHLLELAYREGVLPVKQPMRINVWRRSDIAPYFGSGS